MKDISSPTAAVRLRGTRFMAVLGWPLLGVGLLLGLVACPSTREEPAQVAAARHLEEVTGAHTRLVWLQDAWDRNDVFSDRGQLRLMGLDSRDGRGERTILPGPAPFQKPLITPCGRWIVYSDRVQESVWVVDWDGGEPRELAAGVALALWPEPGSGIVWVYTARDLTEHRGLAYATVVRFPLDPPGETQPVWDHAPVGRDNFQLSADGRRAAGMFPWPDCGMADLEEGRWERFGRGCWTAMAPDNRYRMWMLDGAHRNLTLFDTRDASRWQVPLAQAPGIDGHEVYHPRWSNHPRFMVMTGPYKIRQGGNNIRGGGESVELHVGRFSADFQHIEAWVQVTENPYANFFPDLWVAYDPVAELDAVAGPAAAVRERVAAEEFRVTARLTELSPIPAPEDILPYRRALVANTYVVESVEKGALPHQRILVAHWVIRDGKVLPEAQREVGRRHVLRLHDFESREDLEGERLAKDVEDLLLPLYYDVES